jgi:MFS transporter, PPP family, 3-phenylpropionic acid transporter
VRYGGPVDRRATWPLVLSSISIGVALGAFLPFVPVVLAARGLAVAQVGVVMAVGGLGWVIAVPLIGQIADTSIGRTRMLTITAGVAAVVVAPIALGPPPIITAGLYVVGIAFIASWMPLNDAIIVNAIRDGRAYARIRTSLSVAYALAATAAGVVYAISGFAAAVIVLALGGLTVAGLASNLPEASLPARRPGVTSPIAPVGTLTIAIRQAFVIAPTLPLILLALGMTALGYAAGNSFFALRVLELGGGSVEIALSAALSALVEVPAMVLAGLVAVRFGLRALFAGSGLVIASVTAGWALSGNVPELILLRAGIGVGYGGLIVTGVLTMRALLPTSLQGTGQTLFQATCFGLAGIAVSAAGGLLHGAIGFSGVFSVAAIVGIVGISLGWAAYGRTARSGNPLQVVESSTDDQQSFPVARPREAIE